MTKSGDLNPRYFHKPSLHFYLRMPVVWASSLWSAKRGYLKDINEIRTYNKYGLGGNALTASHPGIVKWTRSLSLAFSLLLICFAFLITLQLTQSTLVSALAATGAAVSYPLIAYSSTIGVDVLMALMCLVSVYFSLLAVKNNKQTYLLLAGIFAGLAVSSKYNAAPIVFAPFTASLFISNLSLTRKFIHCIFIPACAFFAASPYIILFPSKFFKDISYEIWHYSVAGHAGHSANRGFEQLIFYFNWFISEACGTALTILAVCGFLFILFKRDKIHLTFLSFPAIYFLLMVMQKTNFTRNMLVIIPFLIILSAIALYQLFSILKIKGLPLTFLLICLFLLCCIEPATYSLNKKQEIISSPESRDEFTEWIFKNNASYLETALSGQLQVVPQIPITLSNITTIDESKHSILSPFLSGFDRIIVSQGLTDAEFKENEFLRLVTTFAGEQGKQRVPKNPKINIYDYEHAKLNYNSIMEAANKCAACNIIFKKAADTFVCEAITETSAEDFCWMQKRFNLIQLPGVENIFAFSDEVELTIELMSPWEDNVLRVGASKNLEEIVLNPPGQWGKYFLRINKSDMFEADKLAISVKKVYSPFKVGLSKDKRRLGTGVKSIRIKAIS